MEKVIRIDLVEEDFVEKYDTSIVNHNLIDYIIKKTMYLDKNDNIKFVIYNKCNLGLEIKDKIIEGLNTEFEKTINEHQRNNFLQVMLLTLGVIFLFLSTLISEEFIWTEVLVIIGWVPIWEMIDLELFKEFRGRRKKALIERLVQCEFIIENED